MLLVLLGCIPLPWLLPPLTADYSLGVAAGPPLGGAVDRVDRVALGVRPLGILEDYQERPYDFAVGFLYEDSIPHRTPDGALGGFAEFDVRPWQEDIGGWKGSAGPFVAADVLVRGPQQELLQGGRIGLRGQITHWSEFAEAGVGIDGGVAAAGIGEFGVGASCDFGLRNAPEGIVWQGTVGLSLQLPATAGVALVPVPWWLVP